MRLCLKKRILVNSSLQSVNNSTSWITVGSNPITSTKETDSNGYFFNKPCKQWVMGSNPIEGCKLLVAQSGLEQLNVLKNVSEILKTK